MTKMRSAFLSVMLLCTLMASSVSFTFARFDEGMYMMDTLGSLDLKKKGIKIKAEDIYNPKGGGLSEAVVRLSVGCSSEFVSPEGLILTNHHCGFDALVTASTPERDLVENGFKADNRQGEMPAKDYSVFITEREENVTAKILQGTSELSGEALAAAITKNTADLHKAEQDKAPQGSTIAIRAMNNGYFYYLFQTKQIKDVRVVYAPPRNIGVFGGDPDNFEWTRHTGDFTFLRAYVGPDGKSAEYSTNNVPYKPSRFLTMNVSKLNENDAVFVLGYPGGTTRYREASSIEYARDVNFPFLASWLDARSSSLRSIGDTDEEKRIEYQSDIASFDNSNKVFDGGARRLNLANVVEKRRDQEKQFATWVEAKPERKAKYGTVLADLASLTAKSNEFAKRDVLIRRLPDGTMPVLTQIYIAAAYAAQGGKPLTEEDRTKKRADIAKALENREHVYERDMIKYFLTELGNLPAGQKFDGAENLFKDKSKADRKTAEADFAASIGTGNYWNADTLIALYGPRTMDFKPERDQPLAFATSLIKERAAATARAAAFGQDIDRLRLLYQQGMAEMKGITPYPDANSTLRMTYGRIKGYAPREAEYRSPFTTMKGMIEKDTGINPWDMPQKLKDLQAAKDFGRFGTGDSVVVNFISDTDIIGGNSGSPILNANGEQIGICFDGNAEGLGNDMFFDQNYNRTISVDIRYVLFVTEKFGGAGWILNEMKIVGDSNK